MNGVSRIDKINSELQKEIYDVIKRKVKNPFITEMFSIIDVKTSKDLAHANVLISIYSVNPQKKQTTFDAIKSESKKIRFELAKVMRMRTVPEIHFILDGSMEYGDKMDKLLRGIQKGENV